MKASSGQRGGAPCGNDLGGQLCWGLGGGRPGCRLGAARSRERGSSENSLRPCSGRTLVLCWCCRHWHCTGTTLALHWYCADAILVLCSYCTGAVLILALDRYCAGTALMLLHWCCTYPILVLHWDWLAMHWCSPRTSTRRAQHSHRTPHNSSAMPMKHQCNPAPTRCLSLPKSEPRTPISERTFRRHPLPKSRRSRTIPPSTSHETPALTPKLFPKQTPGDGTIGHMVTNKVSTEPTLKHIGIDAPLVRRYGCKRTAGRCLPLPIARSATRPSTNSADVRQADNTHNQSP